MRSHQVLRLLLAMGMVAAIALVCGDVARAHEIGTTRVSVLFSEGRTYDIEIVTDAVALAEKLVALTGSAALATTTPDHLQSALTAFDQTFRQRIRIGFDDEQARPSITYAVTPGTDLGASPLATIRLTGQVPSPSTHFIWSYGWTFASYALSIRNARSDTPADTWLEGGETSKPFAMASAPPPVSRLTIACGI